MDSQQGGKKSSKKVDKKRISITLAGIYLEALDRLVEAGVYVNRLEAIKDALRHIFLHYGIKPFSPEGEAGALGSEDMTQEELVDRIEVLKDSEASIRAERQGLEKQLRDMISEHLLSKGDEG